MAGSILRATFGRLSLTESSLGRITIGHIQIEGTVLDLDRARRRRNGKAGTHKQYDGIKLQLFKDPYTQQLRRDDRDLLELVIAMIEGNLI